jgi:hypothetical protein
MYRESTNVMEAERRSRSDKGTVRLTPRDIQAFAWLADMKAVYETDLGVLLGRMNDRAPLSASATRQMVDRWRRADQPYVDARRIFAGQPRVVMLLPAAAKLIVDETFKAPALWTAYHACEVSHVRLWIERHPEWQPVAEWTSEHRLRTALPKRDKGSESEHVPDGVVTFENGSTVAIEVERSAKNDKRLREILIRLMTRYRSTIYCSHDAGIREHVERLYAQLKAEPVLGADGTVLVTDYPTELTA